MNKIFDRMKMVSNRVIAVQAAIVLSVVYVLCMPLLWIIYRTKSTRPVGWLDWSIPSETLEDMRGQ